MNTPDKELAESGILLVDKPTDWTSHDVVNFVRRRFDIRKVGHCGTLDPIATGLLVLLLGRATRLSGRLTSEDKIYAGTMRLGIETSTDDRAGTVLATKEVTGITPEQVRAVAAEFAAVEILVHIENDIDPVLGGPLDRVVDLGEIGFVVPARLRLHVLPGDVGADVLAADSP